LTDLVVEAELRDPGTPVPAPGMLHIVAIMRYAVVRVLEGDYEHDEIYVGHSAADLSTPAFQPGARHRLELSRTFPEAASVASRFDTRDAGAFYCVSYEVVATPPPAP
jgi:hypothetical protein